MDLRKNIRLTGVLGLFVLIFFAPFFFRPETIVNRGNDLSEEFLPLFAYFKDSFWHYHEVPYWQNIVFSGSPLLGDPQNPWIYLPYWLVLTLPLDWFVLVLFTLHFFIAALGIYFLIREFGIGKYGAILGGIVYALSPKFSAHLEAGHLGMVVAFSLAPLLFLAAKKMVFSKSLFWSIVFGLVGGSMFVTYFTIFYYAFVTLMGYLLYILFFAKQQIKKKKVLKKLAIGSLVAIGISLPQILAGIEFFPLTNRESLSFMEIAQPLWSWEKIFSGVMFPWYWGYNKLQTEEVLFLGFLPLVLGLLGFVSLPKRGKVLVAVIVFFVMVVTFNTKTPMYAFLYNFLPGMKYLRITSRVWFIFIITVSILGAFAADRLEKNFGRKLVSVLIILIFIELFSWGQLRVLKSFALPTLPEALMNYFINDPEYYRIYCTTGCLPLGRDAPKGKGNVAGYNPVHLTAYDNFLARAAGYKFTGFAPILPPYQVYPDKPQASPELLGKLSTRYVISPYELASAGFTRETRVGEYTLYRNLSEKPRIYWTNREGKNATVSAYFTPNTITVDTANLAEGDLILSEIYTPGWKAKGSGPLQVYAKDGIIVGVHMPADTQSVVISYKPFGMPYSLGIMAATYIGSALYFLRKVKTS